MLFTLSSNKHRNLILSIVFFMTMAVFNTFGVQGLIIPLLLESISIGFFFLYLFANHHGGLYHYHYPRKMLFILLLLLSLIAIFRGFLDYGTGLTQIKEMFSRPKMLWPYFFPFLLGCSAFSFDYKMFYKWSGVITIVYAILVAIHFREILATSFMSARGMFVESEAMTISSILSIFGAPLVIFMQRDIVPKRTWGIALLNMVVVFLVAVLNARRSSVFGISLVIFFTFINDKKYRWISGFAVLLVLFSMYANGMLDFFLSRLGDDSRSGVVENFVDDMDVNSWIYGRGAAGTYYDTLGVFKEINGQRMEIETGYLNFILKGGIIYLVMYVLALSYAAFLGIFRSKNTFVRSFGYIIFISLLEIIPYGIPAWNFKYLSIWMGVAICLNSKFREMNNHEVKAFLKLE